MRIVLVLAALTASPLSAQDIGVTAMANAIGMAVACGINVDEDKAVARILQEVQPGEPTETVNIASIIGISKIQVDQMDPLSRRATCDGMRIHMSALGVTPD